MKLAATLAVVGAVGYAAAGVTGVGWCIAIVGALWIMAYLVDFPGL